MAANTLDHLLGIEAQAAAMVNDAQEEAGRRIHENEEKNRVMFEERCKEQTQKHQTEIKKIIEEIKLGYQNSLDEYRAEISGKKSDTQRFNALLEEYLFEKG